MRHPNAVSPWAISEQAHTRPPNHWQLTPDQWQGSARCVQGLDRQEFTVSKATILPGQLESWTRARKTTGKLILFQIKKEANYISK